MCVWHEQRDWFLTQLLIEDFFFFSTVFGKGFDECPRQSMAHNRALFCANVTLPNLKPRAVHFWLS